MHNPELTIGISFYNTAHTLVDLLKSIYAQTFQDWELVLVDDGSTDNPHEIISQIKDDRLIYLSDGKNLGMASRYNQITKIAKGKYIARFDADDICDPLRFEKQINFLRANPSIDVVSCDMYSLDKNDNFKGYYHIPTSHEEIFKNPIRSVRFFHGPLVGRKTWFEKFPYNEKYRVAVDYALYISSYEQSVYASIPEPLYYYRVYETHSLGKYIKTTKSYIDIIKNNSFGGVSFFKKNKEIFERYLRILIYLAADSLNLSKYLISNREHKKIPSDEIVRCQKKVEAIKSIKIPGVIE